MEMQKKPVRKLELKKKTISKLSRQQMSSDSPDSWTIIYVSAVCGSDFTRIISTIRITG